VHRGDDLARCAALQRHIVGQIIDSGNDYLITVKANQPHLLTAIKRYCDDHAAVSTDRRTQRGHGRVVERTVSVWRAPTSDSEYALEASWVGLRRIIRVERTGERNGVRTEERMYYICSRRQTSARTLGRLVQQHWEIENRLHWVKDVIFNEDRCGIRGDNAAENLALLTTIALNLYRLNGCSSVKYGIIANGGDIAALKRLIRT
jgi:predicted transposase YbfD/YdcC